MTSRQNVKSPDSNSYLPSLSRVPRQARMAANGGPGKFSHASNKLEAAPPKLETREGPKPATSPPSRKAVVGLRLDDFFAEWTTSIYF